MNETAQFLGERTTWRNATLTLDDVHGLWGGWHIRVGGDGRLAARGVPPFAPQTQVQKRIAVTHVEALLALCVEWDLLTIRFPPRDSYVPDETHPTLILTNGRGDTRKVTCWAHDPNHAGFEAIVAALKRLAMEYQV
jgi:hypothetical protein